MKLFHLQMLRAVAASAVVIDHALTATVVHGAAGPGTEQLGWFIGWLGVATFFTISGLIMIRTSTGEFGTPGASWRFFRRRLHRVVPLYWTVTLLYFGLRWATGDHLGLAPLVQSLAFIPYRSPDAIVMRPIVGQGWTLNLEMAFYAIFALCLIRRRQSGLALLIGALLALPAAGVATRAWVSQPYADALNPFQFLTDPIIAFFLSGVLIGLAEQKGWLGIAWRWPLAGAVALLGVAIVAFTLERVAFPLPVTVQIGMGIFPVLAVVLCTMQRGDAAGSTKQVLIAAGDASYSTYLLHPLALAAVGALYWRFAGARLPPVLFVAIAVIVANLTGWLYYRLVERPLGMAFRRAFSRADGLGTLKYVTDRAG